MLDAVLKNRKAFFLCGYNKETSLETCNEEVSQLWRDYTVRKDELFDVYGCKKDFYGLIWSSNHTESYNYLIGIEVSNTIHSPKESICKFIPETIYAVCQVPVSMSAFDAWTEYYGRTLPNAGYTPDTEHGFNFEYYPTGGNGDYELWTPILREC
ncbi:GyrI-like domain-containing protein [Sporolactobacillus laevolacticus]|uniref:GyrI-like domain-containing protein n=1 Tax=Sporolactobacillus laevolacticus TaxID=33018 RepID=UPI0025B2FF0A|nr:effector binding domain-containing protein [Sporolactobacillus laevolacticus]MDN3956335.1 effector binding domain-containing protein [Sporolactobacillus laevolacticus]